MAGSYDKLVQRIATRHGLSWEQVHQRADARHARLGGRIGRAAAARTVALSLAMAAAQQRLEAFLAAGSRHVNGLKLDDAMAAALAEGRRQNLGTIGYWPLPGQAPALVAAHYRQAVVAIAQAGLRSSISVKVDLMDYDDALVRGLLAHARQHGVRVHFDAQGFDTVDRTHAFVHAGLAMGADVSATLPSRWQRSLADADRFMALGVPLRIVKGQGGDPGAPKIDPRRSYLSLVDRVAGGRSEISVATHDRRVAEPALERLLAAGTPCVLEQLRSLPRLDFVARERGVPVRVYIAYGRFGLPYAIGEAFRRPAILGWILRDAVLRHRRPAPPQAPR